MPEADVAQARVSEEITPKVHSFRYRWILLTLAALAVAVAIYCVVLSLNWPFEKKAVVDILEERSARQVLIDRFSKTYFPPGCVAEGIRFLHRKHKEKAPLITIQRLVMTTNYARMLTFQRRLTLVRVFDMHVTVPPTEPGQPNSVMPLTYGPGGPAIIIDRTIADGTVLDFVSDEQRKKPLRLTIDKLRVDGIGNNEPMFYRTIISTQMPVPGKLRSTGVFGTWNPKDPGSTPVRGTYRFDNANLLSFGGISGTLFSNGKFSGTLGHVNIEGKGDVPNFKVTDTSHTRRVTAEFKAVVDATKGDMILDDATARFDRTTVKIKGSIANEEGKNSKIASLDLFEENGRIEDLLNLFISARVPQMVGNASFAGHAEVPGIEHFLERIKLEGDFGVGAGKFTNQEAEADVTRLSNGAEKKQNPQAENAGSALSNVKGRAVARNGVATLSHLSFTVPGAVVFLQGTYSLINYKIDLHGHLITTGQPGDAMTGFKSLLLKAITPFFKKRNQAKIVPVKITGTWGHPEISLDLTGKKK